LTSFTNRTLFTLSTYFLIRICSEDKNILKFKIRIL